MNKSAKISEIGLAALTHLVPIPGFGLLMNKRVRRTVRRAKGVALLGAGVLITIPVALYVICKTSDGSKQTN